MIKIKNLEKFYEDLKVMNNVSLNIEKEKNTVIIGPSGCGKTTLLNIIAGLDEDYDGRLISNFDKIGYVFQEDRLLEWRNVIKNLEIVKEEQDEKLLNHILEILEIKDLINKNVTNLSGGQRQRISIARAFYYDPEIILLDEPFKSLDIYLKKRIYTDILKLKIETNKTLVMVTHDIREALLLADNIFILSNLPSNIIKKISIDISYDKRSLDDERLFEYEKEIYRLFLD
ncbi:MAG: ABC transporter ATP-binding protein [Candidatus Mcinerneyibacterium aminivorans]|uniref:ABC transporter ATP-binding protein n=1 Tax=Candidatus Mcinerneyibacterium aminivorans TaxID=2703815 RepID=A0A5D0MEP9_9BACT|nr:MAG: ABC transporter ATP-binding protein [Candidatus Mcinerneyibacterium aminivorans]